jgi:HPt (histidine-containing phosphotransfer) domain-containing protein
MLNHQTQGERHPAIPVEIEESLKNLIPGFLENRRKDIEQIRLALEQADFSTVQTLGHRMKGDGGGYGFDGLSDIGSALELAAARRDRDSIRRQLAKLVEYLDRIHITYVA